MVTSVNLYGSSFALSKQTVEFIVKRAAKSKQMIYANMYIIYACYIYIYKSEICIK